MKKDRKEKMKRFSIWIPVAMHERYKKRSEETGIPMTYLMYMDLENYEMLKSANDNMAQAIKLLLESGDKANEEEPKV